MKKNFLHITMLLLASPSATRGGYAQTIRLVEAYSLGIRSRYQEDASTI